MADAPPATRHGYEPLEVISALQKAIRRGQVRPALYWAAEMDASGYTAWLWKRLLVIASEDVGTADPTLVSTIRDLRELHRELAKRDPAEGRLFVMHATYALAVAPKSRAIVMACCALYSDCHERLEIRTKRWTGTRTGASGWAGRGPISVSTPPTWSSTNRPPRKPSSTDSATHPPSLRPSSRDRAAQD